MAGLYLDDWQQWLVRMALSEDAQHRYLATSVYLLVGRQNGKGSILEAVQLFDLLLGGVELAVHSAHLMSTCQEHQLRLITLVESSPEFEKRILRVRQANGDRAIEARNGCRIRFLARTETAGRGFAGVKKIYLDEAFALSTSMIKSIFSTGAAQSMGGERQAWYTSSAPTPNNEWLHGQVVKIRNSPPPRVLYADFGMMPDERPIEEWVNDRELWARTNPSFGIRISEEFIEEELMTLGPEGFAVERLGYVDDSGAANQSGIDLVEWDRLAGEFELLPGAVVAVDLCEDGSRGGLVAAQVVDGERCVEVLESGGLGTLVEFLKRQQVGGQLAFDSTSQAAMIVPLLAGTQWTPVPVSGVETATAEALLVTDLPVHRGDPRLRAAILAAVQVPAGERWKWSRKRSDGDVTLLVAAAVALSGCTAPVSSPLFAY